MQFHLNGFKPGDPSEPEPAEQFEGRQAFGPLPAEVDVLIVGCGPAGLTLAAQLAAFPDIKTRIVEQKDGPLQLGQADGIACRTMEMFEAFGFSERVLKEAYWVNETSFWKPDDNAAREHRPQRPDPGRRGRAVRVPARDPQPGAGARLLSRRHAQLARRGWSRTTRRRLLDLTHRPTAPGAARLSGHRQARAARSRRIRGRSRRCSARYVVGCDGARSTVRRSLGHALHGDSANQAWGVMDVLAVTDFPDIRLKAVIQSADDGNVLIIPREGGYWSASTSSSTSSARTSGSRAATSPSTS